eukprot:scaffold81210_cov33-Tisochrysis_lutea.AAC.2
MQAALSARAAARPRARTRVLVPWHEAPIGEKREGTPSPRAVSSASRMRDSFGRCCNNTSIPLRKRSSAVASPPTFGACEPKEKYTIGAPA